MKKTNRFAGGLLACLVLCGIMSLRTEALVLKKNGVTAQQEQTDQGLAGQVARAQADMKKQEVGRYGMLPVRGEEVKDGTYEIMGESNSPFFKLTQAVLTVEDGRMSVRFMIPSLSYSYIYPGTGEEALAAGWDAWIAAEEEDSVSYFTIPVEALDLGLDCAAYSKKKQRWYDRKILFDASSLPAEALKLELPDYEAIEEALKAYDTDGAALAPGEGKETEEWKAPEAVSVPKSDGQYSIEVDLTGGSGRASISSPTLLTVRDGRAYAKLLWSSAYYDYMIAEGETYWNLTTDGGNSTFEIPITVLDGAMPVIADTTAMGAPLEIDYTLTFYSDTIGDKGQIPQEAAKKVLVIAAVIIVAGGILNYFVKKKRR